METVAAKITDCSQCFSFIKSIHSLRGIFHHFQVIFFRNCHDLIHCTADACIMNRHDCFGLFCNCFLNFCLINVHGIRTDIHKHAGGSPQNKSIRGGYKGIRRHDHFISRLNIRQKRCHLQCMGTGSCQQYVFRLKPFLHPLGTFFGKWTVSANHTVFFYGFFNIFCFFSHKRWAVKTDSHSSHSCYCFALIPDCSVLLTLVSSHIV